MWDDPHISAQMLTAHLDPDVEAASRRHEFIDRAVEWIISSLGLRPDARVLDLGCGPGLYACRIAKHGIAVHGVDVSRRSIAHARTTAAADDLPATFAVSNYLTGELGGPYDVALFAYEDFCALSPQQRSRLLHKIAAALAPGGSLIMDVTSEARFATAIDGFTQETNLMGGFWSLLPHEVTHETWTYPDIHLILDRYIVATADVTEEYWNWMHCLTPGDVTAELQTSGFDGLSLFGDIAGAPYAPTSPTFAVVAHQAQTAGLIRRRSESSTTRSVKC